MCVLRLPGYRVKGFTKVSTRAHTSNDFKCLYTVTWRVNIDSYLIAGRKFGWWCCHFVRWLMMMRLVMIEGWSRWRFCRRCSFDEWQGCWKSVIIERWNLISWIKLHQYVWTRENQFAEEKFNKNKISIFNWWNMTDDVKSFLFSMFVSSTFHPFLDISICHMSIECSEILSLVLTLSYLGRRLLPGALHLALILHIQQ